ncbi:MAG TPA: 16S rRNA (guanine(966)-N(2))-methyltransferase RsmD [Eoetvoesiella sp.]
MKKHVVRIVGGDYRRTPIPVVDGEGLRPTPDRVRETLYNWLQHFWANDFSQKRVLDLFAGTGALGFEAASRGVDHVLMVENNPSAIAALRALRTKLKADHVRIHAGDAATVLHRLNATPFDLVLLDPPFGKGWHDKLWSELSIALAPDGLVYVESETAIIPPEYFEVLRQNQAGSVHFQLLRFAAPRKTVNNPEIT